MTKGDVVQTTCYWEAENSGFTNGQCWFPTVPAFRYNTRKEAEDANERLKAVFTNDTIYYRVVETKITRTVFENGVNK